MRLQADKRSWLIAMGIEPRIPDDDEGSHGDHHVIWLVGRAQCMKQKPFLYVSA